MERRVQGCPQQELPSFLGKALRLHGSDSTQDSAVDPNGTPPSSADCSSFTIHQVSKSQDDEIGDGTTGVVGTLWTSCQLFVVSGTEADLMFRPNQYSPELSSQLLSVSSTAAFTLSGSRTGMRRLVMWRLRSWIVLRIRYASSPVLQSIVLERKC